MSQAKKTKKSTGGANKRKGSSFEREIAKKLSLWIYGQENVLRRHPTSGAEKGFGSGADIANFNHEFPSLKRFIEVKCGYKDDLFNARKQILGWYDVAKPKNVNGYPIWIIWKLLNRGIILATDKKFKKIDPLFIMGPLYVYDFKELLKISYKDI